MAARTSTRLGTSDRTRTPIDEYPLESCIVNGVCLDLRHVAPRAEITPGSSKTAVAKAGSGYSAQGDGAALHRASRAYLPDPPPTRPTIQG